MENKSKRNFIKYGLVSLGAFMGSALALTVDKSTGIKIGDHKYGIGMSEAQGTCGYGAGCAGGGGQCGYGAGCAGGGGVCGYGAGCAGGGGVCGYGAGCAGS